MNDFLDRIRKGLRRTYDSSLRLPLDWKMIDALETLEEKEQAARGAAAGAESSEPGSSGDAHAADREAPKPRR